VRPSIAYKHATQHVPVRSFDCFPSFYMLFAALSKSLCGHGHSHKWPLLVNTAGRHRLAMHTTMLARAIA
jgi:hypothetical protein